MSKSRGRSDSTVSPRYLCTCLSSTPLPCTPIYRQQSLSSSLTVYIPVYVSYLHVHSNKRKGARPTNVMSSTGQRRRTFDAYRGCSLGLTCWWSANAVTTTSTLIGDQYTRGGRVDVEENYRGDVVFQ